ncbi:RNA polymerase sigma factor [Mucilaginibacter sp.]|uniref:RNA polymerase sigma factor n=1 Tax=Mucilaginibacter sp. TaxID=1882438 RepID=UPI003D0CBE4F
MLDSIHLLDDNELTSLLRGGDETAYTEIYNRYWDKLYFIAHKLLKDTDAAEEIVQEVFLVLWKKKEALNIRYLPQYLASITRYSVYRYLAKEKQYKAQENTLGILNAASSVELNIDDKILLEFITDLSNKLPEKCRLVFQYNKLQDRSIIDIAETLNISQKTAEGHLTKALRIIRANLVNSMNSFLLFVAIYLLFKR